MRREPNLFPLRQHVKIVRGPWSGHHGLVIDREPIVDAYRFYYRYLVRIEISPTLMRWEELKREDIAIGRMASTSLIFEHEL
jgi:hypothetical protein